MLLLRYILTGKTVAVRVGVSIVYGVACAVTLIVGDVDSISTVLGVVVLMMVLIFAVAVAEVGTNPAEFVAGFVPSVPQGAGVVVLSLIATTALPFNIFLASSMATSASWYCAISRHAMAKR